MHPPEASNQELASLLHSLGFEVTLVTDPLRLAEVLIPPGDGSTGEVPPDLFVINACWFGMQAERYTEEQRASFAVAADAHREAAIEEYIVGGGATLALHAAVTCFDTWPTWGELIGGAWAWGTSWHGEPEQIQWCPAQSEDWNNRDTWVRAVEPFSVTDELYRECSLRPGTRVLACAESGEPLMWSPFDSDRVVVSLLGHDERSLSVRGHRSLLIAAIRHLTGHLVRPL